MNKITYYDGPLGEGKIEITEGWRIETMNHPLLTRLRFIKQMSSMYFLYSGCCHSRYDHSLGVGHLISQILPPNLERGLRDKAIFAGTCHDIGHGPFSHCLEYSILPNLGIINWEHEAMSQKLAVKVYDDLSNPSFDSKNFNDIFDSEHSTFNHDIFNLISNKYVGFDIDRLDYLKRDAYHTGIPITFDFVRLKNSVHFLKEFENREHVMCFDEDSVDQLARFMSFRYQMFLDVYYEPYTGSTGSLITDIILEAEPKLRLRQKVWDAESFSELSDNTIYSVFSWKKKSPKLESLVSRFQRQDFYDICGEILLNYELMDKLSKNERFDVVQSFKKELSGSDNTKLNENDIDINFTSINGLKDCDPTKILVKYKNGNIDYLTAEDAELKYSFENKNKAYLKVYCKNKDMTESVIEKIKKLCENANTPLKKYIEKYIPY